LHPDTAVRAIMEQRLEFAQVWRTTIKIIPLVGNFKSVITGILKFFLLLYTVMEKVETGNLFIKA
jgi:hypothetical protein